MQPAARYSILKKILMLLKCSAQHLTTITDIHFMQVDSKTYDGSIRSLEARVVSMNTKCNLKMCFSGRELPSYFCKAILPV